MFFFNQSAVPYEIVIFLFVTVLKISIKKNKIHFNGITNEDELDFF